MTRYSSPLLSGAGPTPRPVDAAADWPRRGHLVRAALGSLAIDPTAWEAFHPPQIGRGRWWVGLLGLWLVQLGLLWLTWGRWPDLIIDFGRELYIPWRMQAGDALYRDLAYFNGPLSPLWHATLFRWFGADFRVLVVANCLVLGWVVSLLYFNLTRLFSRATSCAAVTVFLILFAFGHTYGIGNFNFMSPYSHEMTHGFALCLTLLTALTAIQSPAGRGLAAGLCCGAVLLTKPEMGVAAASVVTASLAVRGLTNPHPWNSLLGEFAILMATAVASSTLIVCGLAAHQGGWERCWSDSLGAWKWLATSRVSSLHFYRSISGLDAPWIHLQRAVSGLGGLFLLLLASRQFPNAHPTARRLWIGVSLVGLGLLAWFAPLVLKNMQLGGLLLVGLLCAVPRPIQAKYRAEWHLAFCWSVLGLGLLAKMFLYPRIDGYGFTLSALLVVLGIAAAVEWLPRCFYPAGQRHLVRGAILGLLAFDVVVLGAISQIRMQSKNVALTANGQGLHSYPCIGPVVDQTLTYLRQEVRPDETVLALPEGVMLNYLADRRNPTRYYNFMPPELEMFGEEAMLAALRENPPDVVLLVRRVVLEYGHQQFGAAGYGDALLAWVQQTYTVERTFGADPQGTGDFGISVLRPRTPAVARPAASSPGQFRFN